MSGPQGLALLDAHAHLTDPKLVRDCDDVLARAAAAGLRRILTCGEDVTSSEAALGLAKRHPALRVAVGFHPHRAAGCDAAALARLRELAADERVVAIGEIGLDLSGRSAPQEAQEAAFAAQLALAAELGLPVVVHVRDAGDLARRLVDAGPPVRGQLHCYSEGPAEVAGWVARGFAVSFSGTVTYPANEALRAAARLVPADRLLVETDAPYLTPQPLRGTRNEPAFVVHTLDAVARARGEEPATVAAAVAESARALFGPRWG